MEESQKLDPVPKPIRGIEKRHIYVGVFMVLASIYFKSLPITLSVLVGVVFNLINFRLLTRLVVALLSKESEPKKGIALRLLVKYGVLGIVLGVLILKTPLHAFAFLVGLSALVLAIVSEALYASF